MNTLLKSFLYEYWPEIVGWCISIIFLTAKIMEDINNKPLVLVLKKRPFWLD